MITRKAKAQELRQEAALIAHDRLPDEAIRPPHISNGDEQKYGADSHYAMSFSKGLEHDSSTGLVKNPAHFALFRKAIDSGTVESFSSIPTPTMSPERKWEAPTAGFVYDLQGPDAQAVSMPPAPALGTHELAFEMAEVYELALLRDEPLADFEHNSSNHKIADACKRMNQMLVTGAGTHTRPRITNASGGNITPQELFRGSSPGVERGPYLSQFMRMGNGQATLEGKITYGAQTIDQRVPIATKEDYLTDWTSWTDAQNGAHLRNDKLFVKNGATRLITYPRDLATYVHDDALYQAYLNACLILLGHKAPFDPMFDELSGMGTHENANVGGFALWGGPHILTLVTEVATRALKAVRYQKFQNHLRLRPEALAARIEKADSLEKSHPGFDTKFSELKNTIPTDLLDCIKRASEHNTLLLPMAFQEGSPMHPSYGAGHATVAGACITVLKAFFDTSATLVAEKPKRGKFNVESVGFKNNTNKKTDADYVPVQLELDADKDQLKIVAAARPLTLEGELNKLAANISIARNMAGVHFFSDYYDSLRMGEEIAIGMLNEQSIGYARDYFAMSLPKFQAGRQEKIGIERDRAFA